MELRLKPHSANSFPLGGILIKGASVSQWLQELQWMRLSLSTHVVYPLPGTVANSVWGCLVTGNFEKNKIDIGRNSFCQAVHDCLYIPEKAFVYPHLSAEEITKLFGGKLHFLHPEIGLVALEETVDWRAVIELPGMRSREILKPATTAFIPTQIKAFQVKPLASEELLQAFEEKHFPKQQKFTDKPLNPFEKAKLFLYRQLFSKKGTGADGENTGVEKTGLLSKLEGLQKLFSKKESNWSDGIQKDFEELERRNQKHLDRLMDMLKNNPEEALKYAIPLDSDGAGRGGMDGSFSMEKRWMDFSLFGGINWGSGGSVSLPGDSYQQLFTQYTRAAQELIRQGDYKKAAFIYMKLLKNYNMAADTLEKGGMYAEAAAIYLKYCNNKVKAAECFEKGAIIDKAIELHKELNNDEKVGDLYLSIHKKKEAFAYYQKVADSYSQNYQFLKASLLYKNKMGSEASAQEVLLKGWRLNRDSFNCLNNFFANFRDVKGLGEAIQSTYQNEVTPANRETFLRVLQLEYGKHSELSQTVKDMAYEIIVAEVAANPALASELRTFNKDDKQLVKDLMRFKVNSKKEK